jgi:hypothetical protein
MVPGISEQSIYKTPESSIKDEAVASDKSGSVTRRPEVRRKNRKKDDVKPPSRTEPNVSSGSHANNSKDSDIFNFDLDVKPRFFVTYKQRDYEAVIWNATLHKTRLGQYGIITADKKLFRINKDDISVLPEIPDSVKLGDSEAYFLINFIP